MDMLPKGVTVNPNVCYGKACIRGTRILVSAILDNLAAGVSREEILKSYLGLTIEDVNATLAYAAELAHEQINVPDFSRGDKDV